MLGVRAAVRLVASALALACVVPVSARLQTSAPLATVVADAERLLVGRAFDDARQSVRLFGEVLVRARAVGDRVTEARALRGLGQAHLRLANHAQALASFTEALPIFGVIGDRAGEASVLRSTGIVHLNLAEADQAQASFDRALDILADLGDRLGQAQAMANLALLYRSRDFHDRALALNARALVIFEELGNQPSRAITLHNTAELYLLLGDYARSLQYCRQALPLHRELQQLGPEAHTLEHMAAAHDALGHHSDALELYRQALALLRKSDNRWLEAGVLDSLGTSHLRHGHAEQALGYLRDALALRRVLGHRGGEAETLAHMGEAAMSLGRPAEAQTSFEAALRIARDTQFRRFQVAALSGLTRLHLGTGRLREARGLASEMLDLIESLRADVGRAELRATFLATTQSHYRLAIDVLMRSHEQAPGTGFDRAALEVAERAHARSLLETLAEARADIRTGVDPDLLARERQQQQLVNAKAEQLSTLLGGPAQAATNPDEITSVRLEVDRLISRYHELVDEIHRRSPEYSNLMHPRPLSLPGMQDLLDRNTLLIEYSLGDTRSYAWAVGADGLQSFVLPAEQDVVPLVRQFLDALTARNVEIANESPATRAGRLRHADGDVSQLAEQLGRLLLRPIAGLSAATRLVIVADGALEYLPFSALSLGSDTAAEVSPGAIAPLVLSHEVIRLPSASVGGALRENRAGRSIAARPIAILADPVFRADDPRVRRSTATSIPTSGSAAARIISLPRLTFSRDEAAAIAGLVPGNAAHVILDFDADRDAAVSPALREFRILHFATHGILDTANPELSGLVMSLVDSSGRPRDGFLRLHDIFNLKLNADLAVLSGCETALGQAIRGEGLIGLTRGFMFAGVPRVVASLWKVQDRATADLMKRLYQGVLTEQRRPAEALRRAQIDMLRTPRWSAAYYWAGFEMQGDWR